MNWFERICRDAGLMLHYVVHPDAGATRVRTRRVQQEQPGPEVTLRRITIEEIEIHPGNENRWKTHPNANP